MPFAVIPFLLVIPAQAGQNNGKIKMDPGLRRDDDAGGFIAFPDADGVV